MAPDVQSLGWLADRLGLGLLRRNGQGVEPENGIMAALALEFPPDDFAVADGARLQLRDRRGRRRRFQVWALDSAWLVQEIAGAARAPLTLPAPRFHPVLRLDRQGKVLEANPAAGELVQYSGLDTAALGQALSGAMGEQNFDREVGGRIVQFAAVPITEGWFLFGSDVTERRHAESNLRQNEARLRALLEAAPDAIVTVSPEGDIDYVNPRGERMFGYGADTLRGGAIEDLIPDWFRAPRVLAILGEDASTGSELDPVQPLTGLRADGSRFPLELSASMLDREGQIYITAILRDVTEREAAAREIRELNQHLQRHIADLTSLNAELEAFSYTVSHDLRGPLRSIDGFTSLLLEDHGPQFDPEAREYMERVRAATGRMADLIDGLLRLSRITRTELHREAVDLSEIARFIADGLQREAPEREVQFQIEEGVVASGDRALLTVVLENLLGNAWKFTAQRRPACIRFAMSQRDGQPIYSVCDNGAGFDMADAGKLFSPFERLHEPREFPGTGIGLATVERVVRRHGGRVEAEAKVGEGACFRFTLSPPVGPSGSPPRGPAVTERS